MLLPVEVVEQIIRDAWGCLSTSSHRHAYSMAQWMLVSRDWLQIVLSVVFRDLWVTSPAHLKYIVNACKSNPESFICRLAGIADVRQHLNEACQSLTISVYHSYEGEYAHMCTKLIEYATTDRHRDHLLSGFNPYTQNYAVSPRNLAAVVAGFTPRITGLHFVFINCNATYRDWDAWVPIPIPNITVRNYPLSLVELHVTFAYTSTHPALLLDAPRGTFFPPLDEDDLPRWYGFDGVKKVVVRDANADFVAFLTTACPQLERVESTAEFRAEDVPEAVPADVKARLVFIRLPRTTVWPGVTGRDSIPHPTDRDSWLEQGYPILEKKKNPIWRLAKRLFRRL
ncbi:hypothetical protein B0H16DRAFT_1813859 [Mycena metata]|uniref:Uncharacterized protein n=1 Tax=Mycena metata TaxID=1033252 RepID=A0AAD7JBH7_9AGAR|nr:hypothetical protein B0H16DRAFT_1813859 [Mycena metata]